MGSTPPPPPKAPEKTLKQEITQNCKQINKMKREFNRECSKLEQQDKKMNKDLKRSIDKKESMGSRKVLAQNILKNQRFIQKYKSMDSQLQNLVFELQQINTMDQMKNVMEGMTKIMGSAQNKMNLPGMQNQIKTYTQQKQKMGLMNEMISDSMQFEDEIDDTEVDNLISNTQLQLRQKQKLQKQRLEADQDQN